MSKKKRIAIIGGGASGTGLLWCFTSQEKPAESASLTLFHDEAEIGGHSRTIPVWFDKNGKGHIENKPADATMYPVDIGVQFVCSTLYPNLYRQLQLPEFKHVTLKRHEALKMSSAFGPDMCWGNFPEYQKGPRFEKIYNPQTQELAKRFEADIRRAPLLKINGKPAMKMTVGRYLKEANYPKDSDFFRYLLIPYLCVINGYGTVDLLETTLEDLYPIFSRIPVLQKVGPYGAFTTIGLGWDRFEYGATQWVQAMSDYAIARGATVRTSSPVTKIYKKGSEWIVEWTQQTVGGRNLGPTHDGPKQTEAFDHVILTTDMTANRYLLENDQNPYWTQQKEFLSAERFGLLPGICYIHQDENVLAPSLRDQKEDGQFTGEFEWGKRDSGSDLYNLPYDLGASFQTYMMQNILGTPSPCYVSMYAEDRKAVVPAPDKTIYVRSWRHGRWVASFFRKAKQELHKIQGLGGIWFAGNNTTVDSEEGALLSAMIVASKLGGYKYPFARASSAHFFYGWFREIMFPSKSRGEWWRGVFRG